MTFDLSTRSHPRRSFGTSLRPWWVRCGVALVLLGAACDSEEGDDGGAATEADSDGGDALGEASIVVTVDDGTVYEFVDVSSCDTSSTKPGSYLIDNGYGVIGKTADGAFQFTALRAGADEETASLSGALEGDFDDEGQNAVMIYRLVAETSTLTVDGSAVAGTVDGSAIAPTRPHGDDASFTVEAHCR